VLMEQRLGDVVRSALLSERCCVLIELPLVTAIMPPPMAAGLAGRTTQRCSVDQRAAGIKGEIDHAGALSFLQGLLRILRDSGHAGLFLVIDEVETLQRVRSDARDKSLNALRQMLDEVDSGRFPGLYLLITRDSRFL